MTLERSPVDHTDNQCGQTSISHLQVIKIHQLADLLVLGYIMWDDDVS